MEESIKENFLDQTEPDMINTNTACKILGVSAKTLRRWCHDGFISYYTTVGGHKRFSLRTINKFLEENYVKSDY
ncbi:MAG: helix-turn-helix domain-containing protein [Bacillota bacterium]